MPHYKIVFLVPHVQIVEARDTQEAHNTATKMANAREVENRKPIVNSIEKVEDVTNEQAF